jgi:hypothetical protein
VTDRGQQVTEAFAGFADGRSARRVRAHRRPALQHETKTISGQRGGAAINDGQDTWNAATRAR